MAPAKKPAGRRQRRNRADIGLVPVVAREVPAVPRGERWLAVTRERWEAFWGSPVASIVDAESDLPALGRLWAMYDELERCRRAFRAQRYVKGSAGQQRLNPVADHIRALEPLIRALEDRFGLTPQARLRLGIEFGQAHRSLAELNEAFDADLGGEADPRLEVIEGMGS